MVSVGDIAPNTPFTLPDGSIRKAGDYRGKTVIIYFYPKDDTSGCTKEAQEFSALAADFAEAGAVVVGLSKDSEKSHAKFIAKYDLRVELGSDTDGDVCEAFGVWVEKSMYGRSYMGIERATFLINPDGVVSRVWRKVKVAAHAAEVLAAVRS